MREQLSLVMACGLFPYPWLGLQGLWEGTQCLLDLQAGNKNVRIQGVPLSCLGPLACLSLGCSVASYTCIL